MEIILVLLDMAVTEVDMEDMADMEIMVDTEDMEDTEEMEITMAE